KGIKKRCGGFRPAASLFFVLLEKCFPNMIHKRGLRLLPFRLLPALRFAQKTGQARRTGQVFLRPSP
ncbi:MAG: hypothetical protein D6714_02220, partial [Bacteroidetes bacterium]